MSSIETYIPMVNYRAAESSDSYSNDNRDHDMRTRHWMLFWWKDKAGRHTADFGVITENMADFCGGLLVYSPTITIFDESNEWGDRFCCPGNVPDGHEIADRWRDFREDMAVPVGDMLGITAKTYPHDARRRVEDYCFATMAAQIAGEMKHMGKNGFMGADWTHGRMTRLVETMRNMSTFAASPVHLLKVSSIDSGIHSDLLNPVRNVLCKFDIHQQPQWYNSNSGNHVHWLAGTITPHNMPSLLMPESPPASDVRCEGCDTLWNREDYSTCPECGCNDWYYDDDYCDEQDINWTSHRWSYDPRVVGNITSAFIKRARRYYWRNG